MKIHNTFSPIRTAVIASVALMQTISTGVAQAATTSSGQDWPNKPIRVVASVPAGGTPDVIARMITPGMSAALGQQLIIDNRGGASGLIGAEMVARAAPDGYTLFFSSAGAITIVPHMQKNMPYDPMRDFAPVSMVCFGPFLLITHPSVPVKSVK